MASTSYEQFCPVAMAAEILCTRWTLIVMRELVVGATRFNDLRRGAPRMSPALLSQRLKALEAAGLVRRIRAGGGVRGSEYQLTDAGRAVRPIIEAMGEWGQRWIDSEVSLQNLDASLLMWDMRRNIDVRPMPSRRSTIQFHYAELPRQERDWWLLVEPDTGVDLCSVDPGFDVDLYFHTDLRTMTAIWMGFDSVRAAIDAGRLTLTGDRALKDSLQHWLCLSVFARTSKMAS